MWNNAENYDYTPSVDARASAESRTQRSGEGERLEVKQCFHCGNLAEEVVYAEFRERVGWWCKKCDYFDEAIGRERIWM